MKFSFITTLLEDWTKVKEEISTNSGYTDNIYIYIAIQVNQSAEYLHLYD